MPADKICDSEVLVLDLVLVRVAVNSLPIVFVALRCIVFITASAVCLRTKQVMGYVSSSYSHS